MTTKTTLEQEAIDVGIEAASDAVHILPKGQQAWDKKEYMIAEIAAQNAARYMKENLK